MSDKPIVILGTGLAGYNLAKEFRKLDAETPLLLITSDDGCSYSKPMLSTGFTKKKTPAELVMANAGEMAEQLSATVRTNTQVTGIDATEKQILIGEEAIPYGKLVLALGAETIDPRLEGDGTDGVFSINDMEDYQSFRAALEGKRRILIMGAGLIGCEFANDLTNGDYSVTLVAPNKQLMHTLLPDAVSENLQEGLTAQGVNFKLGALVQRVCRAEDGSLDVTLSNGDVENTDIVISAIGLRPRVELAARSGLSINQGIVVDRYLQTSNEDIYALGDCAEVSGHVLLYVLPLMASSRALAKTLAGEKTQVSYGVMPVVVKTPACPLVALPPQSGVEGQWYVEGEGSDIRALFKGEEGELLGYALSGGTVTDKLKLNKELPALMD